VSQRRWRVGFCRVAQETNAFSALPSTLEDFRRAHWVEGAALMARCEPAGVEVPGFTAAAELSGFVRGARAHGGAEVELVPLLSAWAVPSGPLAEGVLDALIAALCGALDAAGPLDALYVSLHGALCAADHPDPEAQLLAVLRARLGPDAPLAASFDLHGLLTPAKVAPLTILTAYRTNPHRDHARVGARTAALLVDTLRGRIRPVIAWRSLPMVLGGGSSLDFLAPLRGVFRAMRRAERDPRVLYLSAFSCHMWNDSPELGWSAVALVDGDAALADAQADRLADRLWGVREALPPVFPDARAGLARARAAWLRRRLGTVCVCDASDVVGAGAPGENTRLLRVLLEEGQDLLSYGALRDADAVAALWELPLGAPVALAVGGRLDPGRNPPLAVAGRLRSKHRAEGMGRLVALDLGHLQLVLTEGPPLVMKPAFYEELGLDPWKADICVVKTFFPFRWHFRAVNRLTLYVRTEGVTDFDLVARLRFAGPVWPQDALADWRAEDRRRRALPDPRGGPPP
jgi:microcystin degradation protein MlrC